MSTIIIRILEYAVCIILLSGQSIILSYY